VAVDARAGAPVGVGLETGCAVGDETGVDVGVGFGVGVGGVIVAQPKADRSARMSRSRFIGFSLVGPRGFEPRTDRTLWAFLFGYIITQSVGSVRYGSVPNVEQPELSRLAAGAVEPNLKRCKGKISLERILDSKVGSIDLLAGNGRIIQRVLSSLL
jgi:hypothetical protein